jgi:hypothetical protein
LIALRLHFKEDDGEDEGGDDGSASHHLVDRSSDKVERNVLESGGDEIADGRDRQQELVEVHLLSLRFGVKHTHVESLGVAPLHEDEDDEG